MKVAPYTLIFPIEGDKVLTLHRSTSKKVQPDKINGFGGKVEPGESLETSARRELREETDLTAKEMLLRGMLTRVPGNGYIFHLYIFIATGLTGELKDHTEEGEVSWRTVTDLITHPKVAPHIPQYLEQVIEGKDFYCGVRFYKDERLVEYADNREHFNDRRQ